ncbi:MAG: putative metalloprotease CJM1_0395 family protein [Desulfuromonadaceae bacterium]|nr:putative metalloprotease CJM1_0395 family protein [Desulfuromonadaceae bacterium]
MASKQNLLKISCHTNRFFSIFFSMETIGNTFTTPVANIRDTYQSGGISREQVSLREASPVRLYVVQRDRQEGIKASDSLEEFQPYGPSGIPSATSQGSQLAPQVQAEIARLKSTEEKVKAHEAAHKAAGGTITGPVSFTYTRGPDGKSYISGGEVPIKISSGKTPEETVDRMDQVIRAALAPADPSPQDRAVAAQASSIQQQARIKTTFDPTTDKGGGVAIVSGKSVTSPQAHDISAGAGGLSQTQTRHANQSRTPAASLIAPTKSSGFRTAESISIYA